MSRGRSRFPPKNLFHKLKTLAELNKITKRDSKNIAALDTVIELLNYVLLQGEHEIVPSCLMELRERLADPQLLNRNRKLSCRNRFIIRCASVWVWHANESESWRESQFEVPLDL